MRKKTLKKVISMILTYAMLLTLFSTVRPENVNAAVMLKSSTIKNVALGRVGSYYPNGYCLKFVEEFYQQLGASRPYSCCASKSGNMFICSQSRTDIPIGATVYFGNCGGGPCQNCGSRYYGHVGIYVGDGYFVHATGGKVQKSTLSSWANKYRGYGYCGNFNLEQDLSVNKPIYSNFWLSKKDTSYTEYGLGDNIEVNVVASNYDHLYVGIDKEGQGRVITREINSHYVFSSNELGVGSYSIYVTVANSNGHVDTNTLWFKVLGKPTYSNFWLSKKDTSYTEYVQGENIEVNLDGSNYEHLYVGIDKEGKGRVITKEINSHYVFSSKDLEPGNYSIYVTVANSKGYVDTNTLWFKVLGKPSYSSFWLSKNNASCTEYELGDNITINLEGKDYQHLYVGIDKDGKGRVITKEISSHYTFPAKNLGVGNYSIYITVANSGSYVDTKKIVFKVYEKETAHKFGNWTTTKSATCTSVGTEQRKCSVCGKVESRTVKATGHNYINKVIEPTATQQGYTLHTCSRCGYNYKDHYTNVKKQLQSIVIVAKPSKTLYYQDEKLDTMGMKVMAVYSDGSKNEIKGWMVSGGTSKIGQPTITVSYSEGGVTKTASYVIQVNEASHKYGAWTVTKKATCIASGTEQRKCSVCGKVESRTVKATGHNYINKVINPTATQQGYTLHTCSACGYSYKDNYTNVKKQLQSIVIAARPDKTVYNQNDTIDTTGLKVIANYTDGSKAEVRGWQISGNTAKSGKASVKISYTEGGITKTASYEIEVKEKAVPKENVSLTYDANGGSMSQTMQSGTKGSTIKISDERPIKSVTVSFRSNGGDQNPDSVSLQQSFMRWVYSSASGEIGYYPGDSLTLTENCTLRAQYNVARLTSLPKLQRSGYTFDGWYTQNNIPAYEGMVITGDTVLTAHWTQQSQNADDNQSQTGNVSDWSDLIDYDDVEEPDEDDNDIYSVGDEFATDQAVYTVTKMGDDFCVEYSEMFDDDVESTYIPDTIAINGTVYRVTSVGEKAFYKNKSLKSIVISGYIEKINAKAFYGCTSLKEITITSTKLKTGSIGVNAFKKVNKNVRVIVPTSKYKAYKKLLKKAGIGAKAKIYKLRTL